MEFIFFLTIICILYFIPTILCIILFFRIWRMTDDVREINHNLFEIANFLEESHKEKTE